MSQATWSAVDAYIDGLLVGADPALDAALQDSRRAGLPAIAVSPAQGKFLNLFTRILQARSILEVGTLGGYSTICFARALPADGRLVTLELSPQFAAVAAANIARAGLSERVEVRVGPAADSLAQLVEERAGPFDLIFIDADKQSTPEYFERALELSRPGGVIIVDNVVRDGALIDPDTEEPGAVGMRRFHELAGARAGIEATTIQTVGSKGYDGFTLVLVNELG